MIKSNALFFFFIIHDRIQHTFPTTYKKNLSKKTKKDNGIFFTPPSTVQLTLQTLNQYFKDEINVLEPSCGSCEYVTAINKKYPNVNVTGIEYNETIYDGISALNNVSNNTIINEDYLKVEP